MAVARANAALWLLLAGLALLAAEAGCLRGSALVAELKAKAKAALLNPSPAPAPVDAALEGTAEEGAEVDGGGNGTRVLNGTSTKPLLTGDPKKDYIYDPNLPRELNGYNLSSYPFYNGVPPDIQFSCDDLHDGFYASVPHKCQVYHHCLFGTRYDFLCANYTAFDQRTFICHFVSEVDCDNSPKFYQRNEALYKEASTSPPVTMAAPPPTQPAPAATAAAPTAASRRPERPRRRRPPGRRRRPVYEYYEEEQYDEDEEYYDDEPSPPPTARRKATRKHRPQGRHRDDEDDYYEDRRDASQGERREQEQTSEAAVTVKTGGPVAGTVYDRPRVPPKIRRPVPIHERDKYDYARKTSDGDPSPTPTSVPTREPKKPTQQRKPADEAEDDYYEDDYEEEYVKPTPKRPKSGSDSRRPNGRYRPRQPARRRPDRYDDDYEEERFMRPRKRTRLEDTRLSGSSRGGSSGGHRSRYRDEPDPVPAERPGFISNGRFSSGNRKEVESDRAQQASRKKPSRPVYEDEEEEEYYDDEEEEESDGMRRSQKPLKGSDNGGATSSANSKRKLPPQEQRTPSRHASAEDDRCRRDCDRVRSEEQDDEDSGSIKRKGLVKDSQSRENDNRKQESDRERLFSSRFRDGQNESSKLKSKSSDAPFQGRPSPGFRVTAQSQDSIQRQNLPRPRPNSDEQVTQGKLPPLPQETSSTDISEESSSGNVKLTNFRSKNRPSVPYSPSNTNTKSSLTERQQQETAEQLEPLDTDAKSTGREEPAHLPDGKSYTLPRPFSGAGRRQLKTTTETVSIDESLASTYDADSKPAEPITAEEKRFRKPYNTDIGYKKIPSEPIQVETYNQNQPKITYPQADSVRGSIPVEEIKSDYIPYDRKEIPNTDESVKSTKPSIPDKFQFSNPNVGVYRRIKVNTATAQTPQTDEPIRLNEGAEALNPVNNYKRPYTVVRPFSLPSDRPIMVEDTTKNTIALSSVPLRRPVKQRVDENERTTPADLRQGSIAYFSTKRGKIRPDESLRGQDRYTKRLNGESPFLKQLPKIEITAPGPSAPDSDRPELATVRTEYKNDYSAASQGFTLDIPEEEYDVTLNDALQPSTLHPTRSLVDYRRAGPKPRDPDSVIGGRAASVVAYRAVPASQRYVGVAPGAQRPDDQTDDGASSSNRNQEEYEAIVLTAPGGDRPWLGRQDRTSQPTEWFW